MGAGFGDDDCADAFAPLRVWDPDDGSFLDGGMDEQGVFDFLGGDHFAAALDEVFGATGEEEIVVFVQIAAIAGEEPIVVESSASGLAIVPVAGHEAWAAGGNFAFVIVGQGRTAVVQYGDFDVVEGFADGGESVKLFFNFVGSTFEDVVFRGEHGDC